MVAHQDFEEHVTYFRCIILFISMKRLTHPVNLTCGEQNDEIFYFKSILQKQEGTLRAILLRWTENESNSSP